MAPKKKATSTSVSNTAVANTSTTEHTYAGNLDRDLLIGLINSFYQIQKMRIQNGNRLVAHFYRKLGIDAATKLIEQRQQDRKTSIELIDVLKIDYGRISDALSIPDVVRESKFSKLAIETKGVFDDYTEFNWMAEYRRSLISENNYLKQINLCLSRFPIWTEWLCHIKGIGPTMGGVIISCIDIHKADTPASLWAYAGLDVVHLNNNNEVENRGRGRYTEHLVKREYTTRDGKTSTRNSITFSTFLKTKLVGVLADSFIKQRTPEYRFVYDTYKERITQRENIAEESAKQTGENFKRRPDVQLHRMAIRYMIKRFLVDLYQKWRTFENLPVVEEYGVRKLGLVHHPIHGAWNQQQSSSSIPATAFATEDDSTPEVF